MTDTTEQIDPVAVVQAYSLRNMSAKVGMLAGWLNTFRVFRLIEPEWACGKLRSLMNLQPVDHPGAVVEKAFGEYKRFLTSCAAINSKMRPIGWDYNLGF